MVHYELGYIEQFLSLIDTSKHFVKNDLELSEDYKEKFLKFVRIVLKLFKIKYQLNKESDTNFDSAKLKMEILGTDLPNKYWLLEKLEELR